MAEEKDEKLWLIPAGERQCIWMEAGVVSYKVCTSNYNCSSCQFDHALSEAVEQGEKAFKGMRLQKERRKEERRKMEDTSFLEEFKRLPAS